MRVVQPVHWGVAPEKALALSTLENIADAALDEGLASAAELRDLIVALRACTDDAASLIGQPRIFQVWGQRVDSNC